jgi:plastocyanin
MRRWALAAALLALPFAGAPAAAAPATYTVVIEKMKFGPLPANLHAGDTIVWVNRDMFLHSATARDGSFNVNLPPRTSARSIVPRKGAVAFFCRYHPGMTGVLQAR